MRRLAVAALIATGLVVSAWQVGPLLLAEVPAAVMHPTFAGTWTPSEPARNDELFAVGLSNSPGSRTFDT